MSRRRVLVVGLPLVGLGVALVGVAATVWSVRSSGSASAGVAATAATSTVVVEARDLVVSDSYDGQLGYGQTRPLAAARSGVVTSVAAPGTTVDYGGALYAVNIEPTVLLPGVVPAFRALGEGVTDGPDVVQLEQALADLGYGEDLRVDATFTAATAAAVERWETDLGRPTADSSIEMGDVVFFGSPIRVASVVADVGAAVQDGATVLEATAPTKVVTVDLPADAGNGLEVGAAVGVTLPDGVESTGTVTSIGPVTTTTSSSTSSSPGVSTPTPAPAPTGTAAEPTVPVAITLDDPGPAAGFESGTVAVAIERSRVEAALSVPVTALLALTEGGYAVEVPDDSEAGSHLVPVEVGLFTDDYVEVTGDGIEAGVEVVVPA